MLINFHYQILYLLQSAGTCPAKECNILITEYHMAITVLSSANQTADFSRSYQQPKMILNLKKKEIAAKTFTLFEQMKVFITFISCDLLKYICIDT